MVLTKNLQLPRKTEKNFDFWGLPSFFFGSDAYIPNFHNHLQSLEVSFRCGVCTHEIGDGFPAICFFNFLVKHLNNSQDVDGTPSTMLPPLWGLCCAWWNSMVFVNPPLLHRLRVSSNMRMWVRWSAAHFYHVLTNQQTIKRTIQQVPFQSGYQNIRVGDSLSFP